MLKRVPQLLQPLLQRVLHGAQVVHAAHRPVVPGLHQHAANVRARRRDAAPRRVLGQCGNGAAEHRVGVAAEQLGRSRRVLRGAFEHLEVRVEMQEHGALRLSRRFVMRVSEEEGLESVKLIRVPVAQHLRHRTLVYRAFGRQRRRPPPCLRRTATAVLLGRWRWPRGTCASRVGRRGLSGRRRLSGRRSGGQSASCRRRCLIGV